MKVKGYMYPQMKKPVGILVFTFWCIDLPVDDLYLLTDISLIFLIDNLILGVSVFTNDQVQDKNQMIHWFFWGLI
jgi:hypothetical protein